MIRCKEITIPQTPQTPATPQSPASPPLPELAEGQTVTTKKMLPIAGPFQQPSPQHDHLTNYAQSQPRQAMSLSIVYMHEKTHPARAHSHNNACKFFESLIRHLLKHDHRRCLNIPMHHHMQRSILRRKRMIMWQIRHEIGTLKISCKRCFTCDKNRGCYRLLLRQIFHSPTILRHVVKNQLFLMSFAYRFNGSNKILCRI